MKGGRIIFSRLFSSARHKRSRQGQPNSGLDHRHHRIQGFGAVAGARSRSYFVIEESSGAGAGATLRKKTAPELEPEQLHICAYSKALVRRNFLIQYRFYANLDKKTVSEFLVYKRFSKMKFRKRYDLFSILDLTREEFFASYASTLAWRRRWSLRRFI